MSLIQFAYLSHSGALLPVLARETMLLMQDNLD